MTINSRGDLNRALANALHPEPPLSERTAVHDSDVWYFRGEMSIYWREGHWEPAAFCTDPVSSKLLRDRMRADGFKDQSATSAGLTTVAFWSARRNDPAYVHQLDSGLVTNQSELVAYAEAAARALGLDLDLVEGWDKK